MKPGGGMPACLKDRCNQKAKKNEDSGKDAPKETR